MPFGFFECQTSKGEMVMIPPIAWMTFLPRIPWVLALYQNGVSFPLRHSFPNFNWNSAEILRTVSKGIWFKTRRNFQPHFLESDAIL